MIAAIALFAATLVDPQAVSFKTSDGGMIHADLYGTGERGVVLAHGGRYDKASWRDPALALAEAGFRVLAFDFRGYGDSRSGAPSTDPYADLHLDVLAAVRFLREQGARSIAIIGGSMGATAAADAASLAEAGEIDRLVLLAPGVLGQPEKLAGRKLFVMTRDDPRADGTPRLAQLEEQFALVPEPKRLLVLEGKAHAQAIFGTADRERLMREILAFLTEP